MVSAISGLRSIISLPNVKEHATLSAGARVDFGVVVKATESMADRAAPAVVQPRLVRLGFFGGGLHSWLAATKSAKLGAEAIAADMMGAAVSGKVNP